MLKKAKIQHLQFLVRKKIISILTSCWFFEYRRIPLSKTKYLCKKKYNFKFLWIFTVLCLHQQLPNYFFSYPMPPFKRPLSPLHQVAFTDSWSIRILHVFSREVQICWKVIHYFPVFNVLLGTEGKGNHSSHTTGHFPFKTCHI